MEVTWIGLVALLFIGAFLIPAVYSILQDSSVGRHKFTPEYPELKLSDIWNSIWWYPGGATLFNFIVSLSIPILRTLGIKIVSLAPGRASLKISAKWGVRSYDGRIDEAAMAVLQKWTSTLALASELGAGLVPHLEAQNIVFYKPPEKFVIADCLTIAPRFGKFENHVSFRDKSGNTIAMGKCFWNIERVG